MKGAFYYIRPLLISVVQVLTMVVLHDLLLYLCKKMGYKSHFDIAWGISLQLGIWIFAGVVLLANYLALARLSRSQWTAVMLQLMLLFFLFYWRDLRHTPYKTGLFLLCALIGFLIGWPLQKKKA